MPAPRRRLTHPALAWLVCLAGVTLLSLPLGADPWMRRPTALYPWLLGIWLLLVAFLRALGRTLGDAEPPPAREEPPPGPDRTERDV